MDNKDLNYNKYLSEGDKEFDKVEDYTSKNTTCLTLSEIGEMLLGQPEIRAELNLK